MPAFQFDSNGIDPSYGGGSQLPVGQHPVVIVGTELKPTKDGKGGYLAITVEAIDGPAKGVQAIDRLNLHNASPQAVQIANGQLSAYCAVVGVPRFQATEELHGKPFVIEVGLDTGSTTAGRTEIKKLFDINGNPPGQAGAGAQAAGAQAAAAPPAAQAGTGFVPPAQGAQPAQGGGNAWGQGAGQPAATGGAWSQGAQPAAGGQPAWGAK